MTEFIFERFNYWAIIFLMMIGLYITFQAGNMIKKMVGLSVFQTSVFLFYITLSKIAGGTAPILFGKDAKAHGGHDDEHHGEDAAHGSVAAAHDTEGSAPGDDAAHDEGVAVDTGEEPVPSEVVEGQPADAIPEGAEPLTEPATHSAPEAEPAPEYIDALGRPYVDSYIDPAHPAHEWNGLQEIYSNPLPHVLILTAIVVGVATLAVGLAIIVRIREAYGTIEMDEIRAADIRTAEAEASAETA